MLKAAQKTVLLIAVLLFVLIGLVLPWRFQDGRSAGWHFVSSPPPSLPDSVAVGEPVREHVPIYLVPSRLAEAAPSPRQSVIDPRRPIVDVRIMLSEAALLFLLTILALVLLERRRGHQQSEAAAPE